MSGPFGPNEAGEGRNDPTQVWGGQQPPGAAGPTQQWGGQTPQPAQPTPQWADPNQAQQQWGQTPGQPQQPWGQTGGQPQQPWGQTPGQSHPQQQWTPPGQPQQQPWGPTPGQAQPQQQWTPPGQQPPRSGGKTGLIIGLAVVGVLVLGGIVTLVLLLTATDKLDQNAVQNGVSSVLKDSYGITDVADVSCPADQKVEIDNTFQCTLKVNGEDKKVNIKVTKEDGTYEVGRPS
ncbi:DUF4333 domain-containing protein [Nocardia shimofusensis]|uniref:DUF4333 domain-containing protein n=1 Tax=Nocardia shimofusensis TaxID=228596 RepID=UPI0008313962|nr:DUF4333 domain-containing protein [Nocardia shimofusensis]